MERPRLVGPGLRDPAASPPALCQAVGSAVVGIVARPAAAQEDVAIQIFQTASSLENLAVAPYGAALTLPFFGDNAVVKAFAETTMQQHSEHSDHLR